MIIKNPTMVTTDVPNAKVKIGEIYRKGDYKGTERRIVGVSTDGEYCWWVYTDTDTDYGSSRCKIKTLKAGFKKVEDVKINRSI